MISVVIPCYNAAAFIEETLNSIRCQQVPELEIIIVDDGSIDNSPAIIHSIDDPRIKYVRQENKGVSAARNKGLRMASGNYVIFFDADDIMPAGFLAARRNALYNNDAFGFSCGPVVSFPKEEVTSGVVDEVAKNLLTYNAKFSSCPSNYLIRRSVLVKHHLSFNEALSSTADRYFLIQLAKVAKGKLIEESPLFYRLSPDSMSSKLTRGLILDNERYYNELKRNHLIPEDVSTTFKFKISYILGLGFTKTGNYLRGAKYLVNAFMTSPDMFTNSLLSRLKGSNA